MMRSSPIRRLLLLAAPAMLLAACQDEESSVNGAQPAAPVPASQQRAAEPAEPAPGVDRPSDKQPTAQDAVKVVQDYYRLLEQGRYREAWALWSNNGRASGMTADEFAESFGGFDHYRAEIGEPGAVEGAAGSLYITIPVRVHGRLETGAPFNMDGSVTLRRVNDVPGSTQEQRRWHITEIGMRPRP